MAFPHDGKKFKPGESGNPAGKPVGSIHLSTHIQELLNDEEFETQILEGNTVKDFKGIPVKAIIRVAMIKSLQGDNKWADWLAKYGYGTKLQLGNDPDNPLNPTRELTEQELRDRYQQIVAAGQSGTDGNSLGAGPATS